MLLLWQYGVTLARCQGIHPADAVGGAEDAGRPELPWLENLLATLYSVLGAFALSAVLGVLLAIVIVWNDLLLRTVMPVLVLFNTLPKIALAPLFVIWLGYGIWPNIVIGTTIAFFPMVVNTAVGLASAEPEMLDLVRTLSASRWQVLRKIRFPNALPYIFVGLKLSATMSVHRRAGRRVRRLRARPGLAHHHRRRDDADAVDLRLADPDFGIGPGALRSGRGRRAHGRAVGARGMRRPDDQHKETT